VLAASRHGGVRLCPRSSSSRDAAPGARWQTAGSRQSSRRCAGGVSGQRLARSGSRQRHRAALRGRECAQRPGAGPGSELVVAVARTHRQHPQQPLPVPRAGQLDALCRGRRGKRQRPARDHAQCPGRGVGDEQVLRGGVTRGVDAVKRESELLASLLETRARNGSPPVRTIRSAYSSSRRDGVNGLGHDSILPRLTGGCGHPSGGLSGRLSAGVHGRGVGLHRG